MQSTGFTKAKAAVFASGLAIICLFIAGQIPVIGLLALPAASLCGFVILLSLGVPCFIGHALLTTGLTLALADSATAVLALSLMMVPALLLFAALKLKMPPLRAIVVAILSATLFSTGVWGLFGDKLVKPIKEEISKQITVVEQQISAEAKKANFKSEDAIQSLRDNLTAFRNYTFLVVPTTFLFVWHLITLTFVYAAAKALSQRLGYNIEALPSFTMWRFDWQIVWMFILGWALFHLLGKANLGLSTVLLSIGANCLAMSSIIYFIAGFSLLFFLFDKFKFGSLARVGMSCLALIFTQAVVWLGVFDVWADLRAVRPAPPTYGDSDYSDYSDFF